MGSPLARALSEFIYRFCPSVQHVETLLHIQAHPDRLWIPAELTQGIPALSLDEARDLLATFYGHGFLVDVSADGFRYEPNPPELAREVAALAKAYVTQRVAVLEYLTGLATLNPVRNFADAFIIRRGSKRG